MASAVRWSRGCVTLLGFIALSLQMNHFHDETDALGTDRNLNLQTICRMLCLLRHLVPVHTESTIKLVVSQAVCNSGRWGSSFGRRHEISMKCGNEEKCHRVRQCHRVRHFTERVSVIERVSATECASFTEHVSVTERVSVIERVSITVRVSVTERASITPSTTVSWRSLVEHITQSLVLVQREVLQLALVITETRDDDC
ncbi:hypothetical protein RRG08_025843 [Elysia crispata]|uniref:Secreted protein n=1 Tax=Elysia crispata TaxID=231223 RepID=A0AAE0Y2Z5_9GAST|nr:hypothetical protein RRG08_025843 [Elysia crispata]